MSGTGLLFDFFGILLSFAVAELLGGLARSWRMQVGATRTNVADIRIGALVPLLGLLVLADLTKFWLWLYELRETFLFDYVTLILTIALIGGYYVISTFVFPDEPEDWPDFSDYYLVVKRTVIGGMIAINSVAVLFTLTRVSAVALERAQIGKSWLTMGPALLFFPCLISLWLIRSKRLNLVLLIAMTAILLAGAIGRRLSAT